MNSSSNDRFDVAVIGSGFAGSILACILSRQGMRVALIGDVHGRHQLLAHQLTHLQDHHGIDAAIQVGDFGFYKKYMGPRAERPRYPVPLYVICGNHENHRWLQKALLDELGGRWREENLIYQRRATVRRFGRTCIGFLGGALNIDRPQRGNRRKGTTNFIGSDQTDLAIRHFNRDRPPIIITHSCPSAIGIGMRGNPALARDLVQHVILRGFDPGPQDDCGEHELSRLWQELDYRPVAWCFGHFHSARDTTIDGTRFCCLPCVESTDRILIWDSDAQTLTDEILSR